MRKPKHMRQRKGISPLFTVIFLIFLAVFVFALYKVIFISSVYSAGKSDYADVAAQFVLESPTPSPAPALETDSTDTQAVPAVCPISVDFSALQAANPDTVGWLYQTDTVINYPVVQSEENTYYLTHLFTGRQNANGAIFMDSAAKSDCTDQITAIFGHNMNNGSMFGSLKKYKQPTYYQEHPTLYLLTPLAVYRVDLFAGYVTDAEDPCYTHNFSTQSDYVRFLADAQAKSCFESDVTVSAEDHIIALSTCSYEFENASFVVLGKLVKQ